LLVSPCAVWWDTPVWREVLTSCRPGQWQEGEQYILFFIACLPLAAAFFRLLLLYQCQ
jgi:hypothetical protein